MTAESGKTRIVGRPKEGAGPGPEVMAASSLEGDKVISAMGNDLGTIKEIMVDVPRGRVAYAVLSVGGFLGTGDRLFAIPWHALTLNTDKKCFVLNIDEEQLKQAPGFDKDHWPTMADYRWAEKVHSYYKTTPYWE